MRAVRSATLAALALAAMGGLHAQQPAIPRWAEELETALRHDVPKVVCVEPDVVTGAQPLETAYERLVRLGFHAVVNLRELDEGAEVARERELVDASGLRYINIPVSSQSPDPAIVDPFLAALRDPGNRPMLIHCASAERAGALWMVYRVVVQGWTEERALLEAARIGLTKPHLKRFAQEAIEARCPRDAAIGPSVAGSR